MFADCHNHTCHFSFDAQMSISDAVFACHKSSISILAITEHYEAGFDKQIFDLNQYLDAFSTWKDLTINGPKLLMGIEIGYQKHLAQECDELGNKIPFDTIILSNHLVDGKDIYYYRDCYKKPKAILYKEYIDSLVQMADCCNNYDIIGHYDYINRYNKIKDSIILYEDCPKSFDNLFEIIISKNKCLEINTRSIDKLLQKGTSNIMPDANILKRYKKMGGKMISLGSDSHDKSTIGIHFDRTAKYLKSLEFDEIYYFEKRQPQAITIT